MIFKTREVDGESVLTSFGCLFFLITMPIWIVIGLASSVFRAAKSSPTVVESIKPLSEETVKRRQKRFFSKGNLRPKEFWEVEISYTQVKIPKQSGGTRNLSVPSNSLKSVQKQLSKTLETELGSKVHKTANAYVKGRNTITNSLPHVGCAILIKLDIKDFFPTVTTEMLAPIISAMALYEPKTIDRLLDICITENGLPQGAPTSPILSNLVLRDFDVAAYRLANNIGAKYTRYADDLTFSLEIDDSKKARKIVAAVRNMLAERGFELNEKPTKLKILRRHQAQRLCGITLNSGKPTISRKQRRKLRAAKHAMAKGEVPESKLNEINGWDSYVTYVQNYKVG